ncbi:MAG: hypothetical protein BAJALOKI2v1_230036 [Promethearchaeota archaeon]|nr:MAG: hypothetical protein BAJALOKI2v1_230036 [Candidatus Lokiarchaeota archaeon]
MNSEPNKNDEKKEEEVGIFERSMESPELSKYITEEDQEKSEYSDSPVILNWKAYRRIVGYGYRYANNKISPKDWKEVYGILIGSVIQDKKLLVKNAVPIVCGHRAGVKYEDKQYVDMAQIDESVYEDSIKNKKDDFIVGWFHTHPGFGFFLSNIDTTTQLGYQLPNPFAAAVVFDHTKKEEDHTGISVMRLKHPKKSMFSAHMEVPIEYSPSKEFVLKRIERELSKIDKNMEELLDELDYIENKLHKKAFPELRDKFGLIPKKVKSTESFGEYLKSSQEEEEYVWDQEELEEDYEKPPFRKEFENKLKEYESELKALKKEGNLKDFQKKREKYIKKMKDMLKKPNEWVVKLKEDFTEKKKSIENHPLFEYLDSNEREIIKAFERKLTLYISILEEFNSNANLKSLE